MIKFRETDANSYNEVRKAILTPQLNDQYDHGCKLVGDTGVVPPTFSDWGDIIAMSPHFFLIRFCIWRGFENKIYVCHVLCEELFMLDGRPHIAKLMLKQSLVWYH